MNTRTLISAAASLMLALVACNLPFGAGGENGAQPAVQLSPEQQATGTAGAATAIWMASVLVTATPSPVPVEIPDDPGTLPLEEYVVALNSLLGSPDRSYDALALFMGDPFTIVVQGETPSGVAPAEAAAQLQTEWLPPDQAVSEVPDADLVAILGQEPAQYFGSGVAFPLTSGWGSAGTDQGILIIRERDGRFIWDGVLIARGGF